MTGARRGSAPADARPSAAPQQYQPGDQVLLERGGRWQERLPLSASGAAGSPILYSAYGAQGDDPVIDLGGALPGWSTAGNWHSEGSNVWSSTATELRR